MQLAAFEKKMCGPFGTKILHAETQWQTKMFLHTTARISFKKLLLETYLKSTRQWKLERNLFA